MIDDDDWFADDLQLRASYAAKIWDATLTYNKMGGGAQMTLWNHMKDIHEVKDTQPLSFNHVHCRGVAARTGSVHLIYSMDRKLGVARTHPQQHHHVSQEGPFSKKFWLTTESPQ